MQYQTKNKEFIFEEERPFQSCHASTLLVLADGEILAAWFGGTKEGAKDVAIWCARRVKGRWTAPQCVSDHTGIPCWNPVLYQADSGKIYLFYKLGHTIPQWYTMVIASDDNGHTWTMPKKLVEGDIGGRGPVRNKPIRLLDGSWLAPSSVENEATWEAFVDISYDQGQQWTKSETVPAQKYHQNNGSSDKVLLPNLAEGVIQPTLWESEPGTVHMLIRSTWGNIYRSDSRDSGKTWSCAYPTCLPNNNSGIDLVRLENGTLALVYNPVGKNWSPRTPLVLNVSLDNGETWEKELVLEDMDGEYSYPAIVSRENDIYITYTWKRERIAFWRISLEME